MLFQISGSDEPGWRRVITGTLTAFGQGSGTIGLPGDYTPPSRFIRAAYLKEHLEPAAHETDGVTAAFHVLSNVNHREGRSFQILGRKRLMSFRPMFCFLTAAA